MLAAYNFARNVPCHDNLIIGSNLCGTGAMSKNFTEFIAALKNTGYLPHNTSPISSNGYIQRDLMFRDGPTTYSFMLSAVSSIERHLGQPLIQYSYRKDAFSATWIAGDECHLTIESFNKDECAGRPMDQVCFTLSYG